MRLRREKRMSRNELHDHYALREAELQARNVQQAKELIDLRDKNALLRIDLNKGAKLLDAQREQITELEAELAVLHARQLAERT